MPPVTSFHGEYDFLSNFTDSPLTYEGESYPTVEHAFQAAKTFDPAERQKVREAPSPGSAKRLGRRVTLRPDWEEVKYDVMLGLLRQKFSYSYFRQKLLSTGDADLIEGNTWGDRTWGYVQVKGQWVGKNHLGKLLMQVRAELQAAAKESV